MYVYSEHFDRNDKSDHITHLDNVVQIIIVWPEWGDSNSRHLAPKASALPTALHPDNLIFLYGVSALQIKTVTVS